MSEFSIATIDGRSLCLLFATVDARGCPVLAITKLQVFEVFKATKQKNNGDKTLGEVRFCGQVAKMLNYNHIYYILVMGNSVPILIDFDFFSQFGKWLAGLLPSTVIHLFAHGWSLCQFFVWIPGGSSHVVSD